MNDEGVFRAAPAFAQVCLKPNAAKEEVHFFGKCFNWYFEKVLFNFAKEVSALIHQL